MASTTLTIVSPLPVYLDEMETSSALAPRPTSLEGKVVGLLPNWRPSALHVLDAIGTLVKERCAPKAVVMEQMLREVPIRTGKLLDGMRDQLNQFATQVDVAIIASGD